MKKSILLVILSLFIVGAFLTTYNISIVGADSGFDSSYDSGGSDWDSGSSWDSDFSGEGSSDLSTLLAIPYIFWGIIGLALCSNKLTDKKIKKIKSIGFTIIYILSMVLILILENILSDDFIELLIMENIFFIPFFTIIVGALFNIKKPKKIVIRDMNDIDNDKLINNSFEIYKGLQIAWMNFNYDKIKELVSDEMYNMYVNQLETLKVKNQQNIMDDIEFIEGYITDYKKVNNKEIIKVYLSVSCYDYIINTENKMTVRGNKNRKLILSYILTFERNIEVIKHCPQCGADVNNLTECIYCKSKIVNNTSKMKMTKKEIKSQR